MLLHRKLIEINHTPIVAVSQLSGSGSSSSSTASSTTSLGIHTTGTTTRLGFRASMRMRRAGGGIDVLPFLALVLLLGAAVLYLVALRRTRDRSPWPRPRTAAWMSGLLCTAVGTVGPFAALALRALPVAEARALSRVLRSAPIRVLTHPVVAGTLNIGGLWLLYATPLFPLMHASPWLHAAVHLHVLLTGYLFTASILGLDPDPHRASSPYGRPSSSSSSPRTRSSPRLWAHPPVGVDPGDARIGAELMFYAGDAVDVLLIVLLLRQWYVATRPREPAQPQKEESPSWRRSIASTVSGA